AGNRASAPLADIRVDTTPPTVTYTGNASPYTVDQTVAITCAATDTLSGVFATTCANISAPAYTFAVGGTAYSATATDAAGNVGTGTTTVTIKVTPAGLTTLTYRFVQTSAKYQALTAQQKSAVDMLVAAVVKNLPA